MPFIFANGVNFNYEVLGIHTGKPPVILIAGYICDINFWRPVAEALCANTQVLIFDNQGIGKTTDGGAPLSIEIMTVNIKALLDALVKSGTLAAGPYIIAGFAMGGVIAQKFAADYSKETKKLILLNSTLKFNAAAKAYAEGFCKAREEGDLIKYAGLIYDSVLGEAFKQGCAREVFIPGFAEAIKEMQTPNGQRRQVEVLKSCDATAFASLIKTPTLLVQARPKDVFATLEEGVALAKALRAGGAEVTIYPVDSGHATILENFDGLMSGLNHFLKEVV